MSGDSMPPLYVAASRAVSPSDCLLLFIGGIVLLLLSAGYYRVLSRQRQFRVPEGDDRK
jgi:hypothetical protein